MRYGIIAVVLLFLAPGDCRGADALDSITRGNFAAQTHAAAAPRILSWNVNKGRDVETLAEALSHFDADLFLLQEIDRSTRRAGGLDVTEALARRLHMNYAFAPEFEELGQKVNGEPAYVGQGLVTRLPIRQLRVLRFESQSSFWKPTALLPNWSILQRRQGGRIALVAEFDTAAGPLVVYNAHLESRTFGSIRRAQLQELLEDAKRYPPQTAVVIAGDFNSQFGPSSLLNQMQSAGYHNAYGPSKQRTHFLIGSVDWIFVRGPLTPQDGTVHRGIGVSDHFPLTVKLVAGP